MEVSVISMNCAGVRSGRRAQTFITEISKLKFDFAFVQETHLDSDTLYKLQSVWKKELFHSSGTYNSGGVAILSNGNLKHKEIISDKNGQFIVLRGTFKNRKIYLINVYAPSGDGKIQHRREFFSSLLALLPSPDRDELVLFGGDFNMVTNHIDKESPTRRICPSQNELLQLLDFLNVEDTWRILNPDKKSFTYAKFTGHRSRLDRVYTSKWARPFIYTNYLFTGISDHYGIPEITFIEQPIVTGSGLWIFNNKLLREKEYVEEFNQFWEFWITQKSNFLSLREWWDAGKEEIKKLTSSFAAAQNSRRNKHTRSLERRLKNLINKSKGDHSNRIAEIRSKLQNYRDEEGETARIKSKIQWRVEGEKCSKFFLNLHKAKLGKSTMTSIVTESGETLSHSLEILGEVRSFYQKLFTKGETSEADQDTLLTRINKKVSKNKVDTCEKDITKKELLAALKTMEPEKSPGSDGLTSEFYKFFWNTIGTELTLVHLESINTGTLSLTQKEGIITSVHKSGPREELDNWRPISLLNIDYKILAKALASRLIYTLSDVVPHTQTASVPQRSILYNLSVIRDTIDYCQNNNIDGAILSLDQVKAFDTVDWLFLKKTLSKFGYGEKFIKMIFTLYSDIKTMVKVNGFVSEPFSPERGVRQGCPLSMPLYTLVSCTLSYFVMYDKLVRGVIVNQEEIKLTQFADDTNFILGNLSCIRRVEQVVRTYNNAIGSRLNIAKCQAYFLGKCGRPPDQPLGIPWSLDGIKILGIIFGSDNSQVNWQNCLQKIIETIQLWQNLNLSFKGKRIVINQLLYSRLWYVAQVCCVPPGFLHEITQLMYRFLWGGKKSMIRRSTTQLPIDCGGLGILNCFLMVHSFRLKWISRFFDPSCNGDWKIFFNYNCNRYKNLELGRAAFLSFVSETPSLAPFYKGIFSSWLKLTENRRAPPNTISSILCEPLFHNQFITDSEDQLSTMLKPPAWCAGKLSIVADICHVFVPGIYNVEQISNICEKQIKDTDYRKMVSAIPTEWKQKLESDVQDSPYEDEVPLLQIKPNKTTKVTQLTSREFYSVLLLRDFAGEPKKIKYWLLTWKLQLSESKLKKLYLYINKRNFNNKAYEIRWRILHLGLSTLIKVHSWGKTDSSICLRCKTSPESHEHWFFDCPDNLSTLQFLVKLVNCRLQTKFTIEQFKPIVLFSLQLVNINCEIVERLLELYLEIIYFTRSKVVRDGKKENLKDVFLSRATYLYNEYDTENSITKT